MTSVPLRRLGAYVLPGAAHDPASGIGQARATGDERGALGFRYRTLAEPIDVHVEQHDAVRLAGRNLQPACRHTFGQAVHRQLDLTVKAVAPQSDYFQRHGLSAAQGHRFAQSVAIAVATSSAVTVGGAPTFR